MQYSIMPNKRNAVSFLFSGLTFMAVLFFITGCKCSGKGENQCRELIISMAGTGSGRVTSTPAGINCETDCSQEYIKGDTVKFIADAYSGSEFAGWSGGGCIGTGTCSVTVNENTTVTAEFNLMETEISNLITPYVNESDMSDIRMSFSSIKNDAQYIKVHDGLDIYPMGNLKPFQAVCSGRVHWIYTGDEQVMLLLACNSAYNAEYNFETQVPQTGQIQLENIQVELGQLVSQGDVIGQLFAPNSDAHVHFSVYKHGIPNCPEPYFSQAAIDSMLTLRHQSNPSKVLCYGDNVTPPPMVTPYIDDSDMVEIRAGISGEYSRSPWNFTNDGLNIYPAGELKPFKVACTGTVDTVQLARSKPGANWQVKVLINCDEYVPDPDEGGYFIPFSLEYVFDPMTKARPKAQFQLANISVIEGQSVTQGDTIGYLHVAHAGAHVQFSLLQFGSSVATRLGVPRLAICPEPHFSITSKESVLSLLHRTWPSANMCYQ